MKTMNHKAAPTSTAMEGNGSEFSHQHKKTVKEAVSDIKPATVVAALDPSLYKTLEQQFDLGLVAPVLGMAPSFIAKVVGKRPHLAVNDVLTLLEQDAFSETFVPRSRVIDYLRKRAVPAPIRDSEINIQGGFQLRQGNALSLVDLLPSESVDCIVTSTPYWAMRLYEGMVTVDWADGERCAFGMEQTPEGFIRHSTELLFAMSRVLKPSGSIWWNLMDTYNTRTQIRGNAAEALRAMQGKETRSWSEYDCRRYSAGHSYLKDGEQCLIPFRVAERASRIGLYVKSTISWAKTSSLPEPQNSRVSRNVEYVLHLTKQRAAYFDKEAFQTLPVNLGGRVPAIESNKLSDSWMLPTSPGRDGHGAQFPLALPGRCIGISTRPGELVLDPFVGAGTAGAAAVMLGRRFMGFDISETYLATASNRIASAAATLTIAEKLALDAQVAEGFEL